MDNIMLPMRPSLGGTTTYGMQLMNNTVGMTPYAMRDIYKVQTFEPLQQQYELYNRRLTDPPYKLY